MFFIGIYPILKNTSIKSKLKHKLAFDDTRIVSQIELKY